jgi:hypothetical protein
MDNLKIFNLAEHKRPEIIEDKRKDWVTWGDENSYFSYLMDRYKNSATNNSIINSIVRLMYGKGLSAKDAQRKPNEYASLMSIFGKKDVKQLCLDLKLFGKCAIQVHYSKDRKLVKKAYHIPVNLLAPEKCNEDGDVEAYYFSDNWNDVRNYEPKRIPAFGTSNESVEVLYIQPYSAGMKYFAHVDYQGGVDYTLLEEEIADYLITEVQGSFSGTKLINFNNSTPTEEQKEFISAKIKQTLTGSKGQKIIISFNDNKEAATTIEDIPLNDAAEQYQYLSEECMRKIMLSHSVTSPLIFGIATSTGFSSNADELQNSFNLFDNMVIKPFQEMLLDAFDTILEYNGVSLDLYFKTLNPFEGEKSEEPTQLSKQFNLEDYLNEIGEDIPEDWILVDERDVTYEELDELDMQLEKTDETLLSKILNFVSTGTARPKAKSFQDKTIKGVKWKVRYQYAGNPNPERDFCKAMMKAKKIYRREDLENMNSKAVNPGFEHNNEPYNVFLFGGGPRCKHYFKRLTFASVEGGDVDVTSPNARKVGTAAAARRGYKITNPYQVRVPKNNLPNKGFHPNNKNLPKDVK